MVGIYVIKLRTYCAATEAKFRRPRLKYAPSSGHSLVHTRLSKDKLVLTSGYRWERNTKRARNIIQRSSAVYIDQCKRLSIHLPVMEDRYSHE